MFALLLLAATWRLWIPHAEFPEVPLFGWALWAPGWLEWSACGGIVASLCCVLVAPRSRPGVTSAGLLAFAGFAIAAFVLDQQRMQPWMYLFVLLALVLAVDGARNAIVLCRVLIVGFYFHSALSKFDYSFLHTLGQQFLATLVGDLGASIDHWNVPTRLYAAAVFPIAELLIAAGLCFSTTRRLALIGAVSLHVLLLVTLGPWGLNHKPGVLIWNAYFIAQDLILFGGWRRSAPLEQSPVGLRKRAPGSSLATAIVLAATFLPLLAPIGWFDLWPSWGLYAPSAERVSLWIHRGEIEKLPRQLQTFCTLPDDSSEPWARLRLDRWALETLGAPLYPQNRVQMGVAQAVIARWQLDHRVRVARFSMAARLDGARNHDVFSSLPQMAAAESDYIFNSRPRSSQFNDDPQAR